MKKIRIILFFVILASTAFSQEKTLFDYAGFVVEPIKVINTVGSDISPLFVHDSLYFSAIREDYFNKDRREKKNKAFYDMYSAALNNDGILTSGRLLVPGFGNDWHEGPADYCETTGELFITLSNVINPDTLHKVISVEKIRLRLAIMKKMDGNWKITEEFPYNNDKYNLAHPAVTVTGDTLIYSCDIDTINTGNKDLFMSIRKNGRWSVPVNLGNLVNTQGNEMFPTFIGGGLLSFASNGHKGGQGDLDIWYTDFPGFTYVKNAGDIINSQFDDFGLVIHKNGKTGYFSSNRNDKLSDDIYRLDIISRLKIFKGKVLNRLTDEPIANSKVELQDCTNSLANEVFTNDDGDFTVQVLAENCPVVVASKAGFSSDKKNIEGLTYVELKLAPLKKYELIVLDIDSRKPISGAEIMTGTGDKLVTSAPGMIGFGNTIQQGTQLVVKKEGYLDQSLAIDTLRLAAVDTVWLYKKELNKTFVLDNIYYNFDKWDILPESEIELNKLIKIMNDNPDIKVELGSHTDSRGPDSYNEWLSQKRSDSAVDYIIKNGIPKSKIVAKGYGESQLINKCTNGVTCSDAEHRKNRRTEFKIIGF